MTENHFHLDGDNITETTDNATKQRVQSSDGYLAGIESELSVTQNIPPAMNVLVTPGEAWIRGVRYENTTAKTVTVGAADTTYSRIDTIVLRLTWAANTVEAVCLAGTHAASPTATSLTQSVSVWELGLYTILVPVGKTSIITSDLTDNRLTQSCGVAACRLGVATIDAAGNILTNGKQISLGTAKITGLGDPTAAQDADTLVARNAAIAAFAASGTLLATNYLIAGAGSFVTSSKTTKIRVTVLGGGGNGAGVAASPVTNAGTGGGSGGIARKTFSATPSTSYAYSVGAAGVNSTFVVNAITVTGGGAVGATGGTATNGDLNILGGTASYGYISNYSYAPCVGGGGEPSPFGNGGAIVHTNYGDVAGRVATGYGAGGGGAAKMDSATVLSGGAGTGGLIIVEEYA